MLEQRYHMVHGLYVGEAKTQQASPGSLVMIPGSCHGWWAYEEWLPFFAERGWKSYALSLRNHTGSYPVPDDEYIRLSVQDYVNDVSRVLEWIGAPVVLLGHSMGGIVAQKVAELFDLKALVLVGPVGPGQLGTMNEPVPEDQPIMPDAEAVRRLWFHEITDERFAKIYGRLVPESPSVINEYRGCKVRVDRGKIRCPILVIEGQCDHSGVHDPESVARFYDATCIVVPSAGHDLMLEPVAAGAAERIHEWLLGVIGGAETPRGPD